MIEKFDYDKKNFVESLKFNQYMLSAKTTQARASHANYLGDFRERELAIHQTIKLFSISSYLACVYADIIRF